MADTENIYLIGMMGCGKSVTGRILAVFLNYGFTDFDNEIENLEKRKITEIFAQSGEPYFRDVESAILERCSKYSQRVFATGGGIVLRDKNVQLMKKTGTVVLLQTSAETLWQRLSYSKNRPLLNRPDPLGTLRQILSDRERIYQEACDFSVVTDGKIPNDVAQDIFHVLKSKL